MSQPAIFLPHGGGPCFFMEPPPEEPTRWVALETYLRSLPSRLPERPAAILLISGHWEMPEATVLAGAAPALLYDYYNFPPHTYQLSYPAPGAPALAARVQGLLEVAGIRCARELERGFDHGVFVPMKVAFPDADLPILQLSLKVGLDPAEHLAIGRALATLRDDNVVVIGSGLSFHNLRLLGDPRVNGASGEFDAWLHQTLCEVDPAVRERRLVHWAEAPQARLCHPREEHLLPLMVAVGAAGGAPGRREYHGTLLGKELSAWHFG